MTMTMTTSKAECAGSAARPAIRHELHVPGRRRLAAARERSARQRAVEQALVHSERQLRALAAHQDRIKERERLRISQELHDELGGLLTAIKACVAVAGGAAQAGSQQATLLAEAAALADDAIGTVRRVATDLRPSVLDQLGIWVALEWCLNQTARRSALRCQFVLAPELAALALGRERELMMFRVVQEALTNVVRHAGAGQVELRVAQAHGKLIVSVCDDGVGIGASNAAHGVSWGILGMKERARHAGAKLAIGPAPGRGTQLTLTLPLELADA